MIYYIVLNVDNFTNRMRLDKIKGIIAKPMAKYWYNLGACKDNRIYNQFVLIENRIL